MGKNDTLVKQVMELAKRVEELEVQVRELTSKRNSGNSSMPPSQDQDRAIKSRSLRKKSGRSRGGQPGHKGASLEMTKTPDELIEHVPGYCQACGEGLEHLPGLLSERRQVVDVPPIEPVYTEHRIYSKTCLCGHVTKGAFPSNVKAPIQYGPGVESMAGYLSVRQYLPYRRMKECFDDLFGIPISEGSLVSAVRRMGAKSLPLYHRIKENILRSPVVGADETGAKVNGKKAWFWVWQSPGNTFIAVDPGRGFNVIKQLFPKGLTNSILVSDCWAAHLKTPATTHQLCIAHLLRELNLFIQLYDDRWAKKLKKLLLGPLKLKSEGWHN